MQINNPNSPYPLQTYAQGQMDVALYHTVPMEEVVSNVQPMGPQERAKMEKSILRSARRTLASPVRQ